MKKYFYSALLMIFLSSLSYAMEEEKKEEDVTDDFETIVATHSADPQMNLTNTLLLLLQHNLKSLSGGTARYLWKQTSTGQQTLVGLGDNNPEKAKTGAIYKDMINTLEEGKENPQLFHQFQVRQQIATDFVCQKILELVKLNQTANKTPDDIGSMLTTVAEIKQLQECNGEYAWGRKINELITQEVGIADKIIFEYQKAQTYKKKPNKE